MAVVQARIVFGDSIRRLGDLTRAATKAGDASKVLNTRLNLLNQTLVKIGRSSATSPLAGLGKQFGAVSVQISAFQRQLDRIASTLSGKKLNVLNISGANPQQIERVTQALEKLSTVQRSLASSGGGGGGGFGGGIIGNIGKQFAFLGPTLQKGLVAVSGFFLAVGALRVALLSILAPLRGFVDGFAAFVVPVVRASQSIEVLRRQLLITQGNASDVNDTVKFLLATSNKFGTSFDAAAASAGRLAFALRGILDQGEFRKVFEGFSIASSVFRISPQDQNRALRAFEQIGTLGKVRAEELRSQLGDVFVGISGIISRGLGISRRELNEQLEAGTLDARKFFLGFVAGTKELEPAAREAAESVFGQFQILQNKVSEVALLAGEDLLEGLAVPLRELNDFLSNDFNLDKISTAFRGLGIVIGETGRGAIELVRSITELFSALKGAQADADDVLEVFTALGILIRSVFAGGAEVVNLFARQIEALRPVVLSLNDAFKALFDRDFSRFADSLSNAVKNIPRLLAESADSPGRAFARGTLVELGSGTIRAAQARTSRDNLVVDRTRVLEDIAAIQAAVDKLTPIVPKLIKDQDLGRLKNVDGQLQDLLDRLDVVRKTEGVGQLGEFQKLEQDIVSVSGTISSTLSGAAKIAREQLTEQNRQIRESYRGLVDEVTILNREIADIESQKILNVDSGDIDSILKKIDVLRDKISQAQKQKIIRDDDKVLDQLGRLGERVKKISFQGSLFGSFGKEFDAFAKQANKAVKPFDTLNDKIEEFRGNLSQARQFLQRSIQLFGPFSIQTTQAAAAVAKLAAALSDLEFKSELGEIGSDVIRRTQDQPSVVGEVGLDRSIARAVAEIEILNELLEQSDERLGGLSLDKNKLRNELRDVQGSLDGLLAEKRLIEIDLRLADTDVFQGLAEQIAGIIQGIPAGSGAAGFAGAGASIARLLPGLAQSLGQGRLGRLLPDATDAQRGLVSSFISGRASADDLSGAFGSLSDTVVRQNRNLRRLNTAATFAGLALDAIAAFTVDKAATAAEKKEQRKQEAAAIGAIIGSVIGGVVGSAFPVVGTAAGVAIGGALGGAIGGLFGGLINVGGFDQFLNFGTPGNKNNFGEFQRLEARNLETSPATLDSISNQVVKTFNQLATSLGSFATFVPAIGLKIEDSKKFIVQGFGVVLGTFTDQASAVSFLLKELVTNAVFSGIDPIVKAGIDASTATSFEELADDIQFLQQVSRADLSPFAQGLAALTDQYRIQVARVRQLIGNSDQYAKALDKINVALIRTLKEQRRQITGEEVDEEAERRIQADEFNAELDKIAAEIQEQINKISAQIAVLNTIAQGKDPASAENAARRIQEVADALGITADFSSIAAAQQLFLGAATEFAGLSAEEAAAKALELAASIQALVDRAKQITDLRIKPEDIRPRGDGGSGARERRQAKEELTSRLRGIIGGELLANFLESELRIKQLAEEAKKLGISTDLVREAQERLRENQQQQIAGAVDAFFGVGQGITAVLGEIERRADDLIGLGSERTGRSDEEIRGQQLALQFDALERAIGEFSGIGSIGLDLIQSARDAQELRDAVNALGLDAQVAAALLAEINLGEEAQRVNAALSVVNGLLAFLPQAAANEEEILRIRQAGAKIELAILKAQAIALGIFEDLARFFGDAEAFVDDIGNFRIDLGGGGGGGGFDGPDPNDTLNDLIEEFKNLQDALRDFREELFDPTATPEQAFQDRLQRVLDLSRIVATGSGQERNDALAALPDATRDLLDFAQRFFGSTSGFQQFFALLQQLLGGVNDITFNSAAGSPANAAVLALIQQLAQLLGGTFTLPGLGGLGGPLSPSGGPPRARSTEVTFAGESALNDSLVVQQDQLVRFDQVAIESGSQRDLMISILTEIRDDGRFGNALRGGGGVQPQAA